jgi:glycosyltransferase involved in cell wall biosynthesis
MLDSLTTQQDAVGFEVIVVDNGSSDDTLGVARAFAEHLPLHYLREDRPGLHAGRHAGMRRARGPLLLFTDDDVRADVAWIASVRDAFADADVSLVTGQILPEFEETPPTWVSSLWQASAGGRLLPEYSLLDLGNRAHDIDPELVWGCNFGVRRSLLEQVGGFHPDGMPRDLIRFRGDGESYVGASARALGRRAVYQPEARIHHWVSRERMTPGYVRRRSFDQGISDSFRVSRQRFRVVPGVARLLRHWARLATIGLRMLRPGIQGQAARGYLEGYAYHRRQLRADPELRTWVHRPNFLDA